MTPYLARIEQAIAAVRSKTAGKVPEIELDIVFKAAEHAPIPEIRLGGYSPKPSVIYISLASENVHLEANHGETLERLITHELHHALRWDCVGYGTTLFEAVVSECLSDRFSQEIYSHKPPLWTQALSVQQISSYVRLLIKESDTPHYNHYHWFYGSGALPRWTGYTLGWLLIGNLSGDISGLKPSELIATPASAFTDSLAALCSMHAA